MTDPALSVVITAYRRREFLRSAVDSVLAQSLARGRFEVLVLKDFIDPELDGYLSARGVRVTLDRSEAVGGMLAHGIREARGEILVFLDDDDEFEPGKLEAIERAFALDPALTYLRNSFVAIDRDGRPLPAWGHWQVRASYQIQSVADRVREIPRMFATGAALNLSCISVRRAALEEFLPLFPEMRGATDLFTFFCCLARPGTLRVEAGLFTRYRVHESTSKPELARPGSALPGRYVETVLATAAVIERITAGSPASPMARCYVSEVRFDAYLRTDGAPPPSFREYREFAATILHRRRAYHLRTLGLALIKRIAPLWSQRAYAAGGRRIVERRLGITRR